MKELHLICESHIDPIWLWKWEEGAAAAISTFQSAVNLAGEFDYVFCHNEVTLYKYIEDYAPELFERIKELVKAGKWHIMGGWYLQPDCNMPSGESFIRQIKVGQKYFYEKFGVKPTTAVNFDSFGHSKGLVQIIKKCGQDSYIFMRPFDWELDLKDDLFTWKGFDSSEIKAFRSPTYNSSPFGNAANHISRIIEKNSDRETWLCLWGVGNHGGGPSRKDLHDLKEMAENSDTEIIHSIPEDFFKKVTPTSVVDKSLRISMPGCYTSVSQMKRRHIALENSLYSTEKELSAAEISGLMSYPENDMNDAVEDLLNAEFHDVLPGSAIKDGIENGFRLTQHAMQITERARAKAFFAMSQNEPVAESGEYPILVFNPHPYSYSTCVEVELNLADQNFDLSKRSHIRIFDGEKELVSQMIQEDSNLLLDWRKRIIFNCTLPPLGVKRFKAFVEFLPAQTKCEQSNEDIIFDNGAKRVVISAQTGLMTSYQVNGREYLDGGAFEPYLYDDNEDPWGMQGFQHESMGRNPVALKKSDTKSGVFKGRRNVKIVEDGAVELAVESFFELENVGVRLLYIINKLNSDVQVKVNALWNEKNKMLKLHIPTTLKNSKAFGQTAFGTEELFNDGKENVSHRFVSLREGGSCLSVINNCLYGSSESDGEIRLSLLRGARFSGHPIDQTMPQIGPDRYVPIIDLGEHEYNFILTSADADTLDRKALEFNQPPYALNVFPTGNGKKFVPVKIEQSNPNVIMTTLKKGENQEGYVARFYNGTDHSAETDFSIGDVKTKITFGAFEVKTVVYDGKTMTISDEIKI